MPDHASRPGAGGLVTRNPSGVGPPRERGYEPPALVDNEDPDDADGLVRGYMHSAETSGTVNGPGLRYTIFMSGCPLRCLYCHNPDTWEMRMGARVTVDQVVDDIAQYAVFIKATDGGLTASGGEPLLQPRFLTALFRRTKERLDGMHTALDTSGFLGGRATNQLLDSTDLVLLDIKSGDPAVYREVTGVELQPTLDFARRLSGRGNRMWIRYVLVPGLTDAEANVARVADFVAGLDGVERVEVLPYHRMATKKYAALHRGYPLEGTPEPTPELVASTREIFATRNVHVL